MTRLDDVAHGEGAEALAQTAATLAPAASSGAQSDHEAMAVSGAHEQGLIVFRVSVGFDEGCRLAAARAFMVMQELEAFGDLITSEPAAGSIQAGEVEGGVAFWIAAAPGTEAGPIRARVIGVSEVASCEVEQIEDTAPAAHAAQGGTSPRPPYRAPPRGRPTAPRARPRPRSGSAPTASTRS